MSISLPPDIPEKFRKDFVLGYLHNQIAKLFCVLGREKLPKLYQIALNDDISFDTLRALDEEKGQKLAEKIKMVIYENIVSLYEKSKSRRYKWYSYLNRKRSEDNLMKRIKKEYGIDVSIFIGDWSNGNHQMKNFVSTPRIGLKRKLKKHFKVYNLDEYKTSKMCYKTKEETKNLKVKIKDKEEKIVIKKLHPVLTYRMENNRIGCLNRDKNSCLNMLNIIETWKLKKEYPTYLKRSISNDNPL